MMTIRDISSVVKPLSEHIVSPDAAVLRLLTDSRTLTDPDETIFFAIRSKRNSGIHYVADLYAKGVRNFVVPADLSEEQLAVVARPDVNLWQVKDVVRALQLVAAANRQRFDIPVVGITGSNGKTIVKDWLVQLLSADRRVVASPKSYNSQIGVPLSVWQMGEEHDVAVFEAGISEPSEMENLRNVIRPTIGIFTNIGQAHDENFLTRNQKIAEKLQLFTHCDTLIYCADHKDIHSAISEQESFRRIRRCTWGSEEDNAVRLIASEVGLRSTILTILHDGETFQVEIPFVDRASIENAMQCVTLMFVLGYDGSTIAERCKSLVPVAMRLEMNEGNNNCLLINDSYSLDVNSLTIALDFLQHEHQHYNKTLILSDILQSGLPEKELYSQVADLVKQRGITRFVGIGEAISRNRILFADIKASFYPSTEAFLLKHPFSDFQSQTILLKGARLFQFERIAKVLQRKSHETIMEVNLDALVRNLNFYRSRIKPTTKLMAMVKAASYGAGKVEIANILQFNHVDYLTVAYADEGVELRRNGITLPIMVMNPEEESFDNIVKYNLEPDIYSFRTLNAFFDTASLFCASGEHVSIHIEFDTGMHRLGFSGDDLERLAQELRAKSHVLQVQSIFSHLACADDAAMDDFTRLQISRFREWSSTLKAAIDNSRLCCHILNSAGIVRFNDAQMDMVRLGIGLYGIAPDNDPVVQAQLTPVSRLKTRVSQVKAIPAGDSVGYNRRWVASKDSRIAIIPIGYADGLSRRLGYGNGRVLIEGQEAPIIGSICMDMCFVDVTDIACNEGDEVVIFGDARLLKRMSDAAGTIPYEILTAVSPRVKRVYYQE